MRLLKPTHTPHLIFYSFLLQSKNDHYKTLPLKVFYDLVFKPYERVLICLTVIMYITSKCD